MTLVAIIVVGLFCPIFNVCVCADFVQLQCVADLQCFSALCPPGLSWGVPVAVSRGGVSLWQEGGGRLLLSNPVGVCPDLPRPWDTSTGMAGGEPVLYVFLSVKGNSNLKKVTPVMKICVFSSWTVPKCPIGMQYSECTKSCSTNCHSLNIQEVCKEECVDGCTCPGNH